MYTFFLKDSYDDRDIGFEYFHWKHLKVLINM